LKHTFQQVFHSSKFITGFVIFALLLLTVIFYPLFVSGAPLQILGQGTFFPPGVYVNVFDSVNSRTKYTLSLDDATANRISSRLSQSDREAMKEWLIKAGVPENQIDIVDTAKLLDTWEKNYDPNKKIPGMIYAKVKYYQRLDESLDGLLSTDPLVIAAPDEQTGQLTETGAINPTDYVNTSEVANVRWLPLGTDNFGRDVLTELVKATGVSLEIGLVAGLIATLIGLTLGLLAGYVGGWVDDVVMFVTNLFTVIPPFVLFDLDLV